MITDGMAYQRRKRVYKKCYFKILKFPKMLAIFGCVAAILDSSDINLEYKNYLNKIKSIWQKLIRVPFYSHMGQIFNFRAIEAVQGGQNGLNSLEIAISRAEGDLRAKIPRSNHYI